MIFVPAHGEPEGLGPLAREKDGEGGRKEGGLDLIRRGIETDRVRSVRLDGTPWKGDGRRATPYQSNIHRKHPVVRGRDEETRDQSRGTLLPRSWPSYQT